MINPIFDFIDETVSPHVFRNMGFDAVFTQGAVWPSKEHDNYTRGFQDWLDNWEIDVPEGYTLISKYDTEDGPYALMVKPLTQYANLLLEFGDREDVKEAVSLDRKDWAEKMRDRRTKS